MIQPFLDDDKGFIRWRDTHPNGYVVNHERMPHPRYMVLHRADCPTLSGAASNGRRSNWTSSYGKTCYESIDEIRTWARRHRGEPQVCSRCQP